MRPFKYHFVLFALLLSGCADNGKNNYLLSGASLGGDGNYGGALVGRVGTIDDAPKSIKPIDLGSMDRHPTPSSLISPVKDLPPELPLNSKLGFNNIASKREYDFSLKAVEIVPPEYLPRIRIHTYDLTVFNRGYAPVSVVIDKNKNLNQYVSSEKSLPISVVVPPKTDQTILRFVHKPNNQSPSFSFMHTYSIGDYTARHNCPEHYRFPFGDKINAFASVNDNSDATPFTRHAVIFSLPVGTSIVAARKGTVVQSKFDYKLDILHDDLTIASYSHLGKIDQGIFVGKAIAVDDIIGIAGTAENPNEAYIQLTVWRPEPVSLTEFGKTNSSNFNLVSFPLEFCSMDSKMCGVITRSQSVTRSKGPERKSK